jgi:hypothetical protein
MNSTEKIFTYCEYSQDVTAPKRKTVHVATSILRQTGSLLEKKRTYSNCPSAHQREIE